MGQCGCCELSNGHRFPGPGGKVYVLEIYPGCQDCNTPAGATVYLMDPKKDAEFLGGIEDAAFETLGHTFSVPVFDPAIAVKEMVDNGLDEYEAAECIGALYSSVRETLKAWKKLSPPQATPNKDKETDHG